MATGIAALSIGLLVGIPTAPGAVAAREGALRSEASATVVTRTSTAGEVTIAVTWRGPSAGLAFGVRMNTHMVDLSGYDLARLARLWPDGGRAVTPIRWTSVPEGHHRTGQLIFPGTRADGSLLIDPRTHTITLAIRGVAGVPERRFTWTLASFRSGT